MSTDRTRTAHVFQLPEANVTLVVPRDSPRNIEQLEHCQWTLRGLLSLHAHNPRTWYQVNQPARRIFSWQNEALCLIAGRLSPFCGL
jgi:hypothetical protein